MANTLIELMAQDLHLFQRSQESTDIFACRTVYSGLRYWIQAYCINDGYAGAQGISLTSIEHAALEWIDSLGTIYAAIPKHIRTHTIQSYCEALITVGDLVTTTDNLVRCTEPHQVAIFPTITTTLGLIDPTAPQFNDHQMSGCMLLANSNTAQTLRKQLQSPKLTDSSLAQAWRILCDWPTFTTA